MPMCDESCIKSLNFWYLKHYLRNLKFMSLLGFGDHQNVYTDFYINAYFHFGCT